MRTRCRFAIALALVGVNRGWRCLGPVAACSFSSLAPARFELRPLAERQSRWSWLPYVVALRCPAAVRLVGTRTVFAASCWPVYLVGLPLVPAAHIANVLPDVEADRASGRRNLAVIWGRRLTLRILASCLLCRSS